MGPPSPSVFRTALLFLILAGTPRLVMARPAAPSRSGEAVAIDSSTWIDHDTRKIREPKEHEPNLPSHLVRESVTEELGNAFDIPDKILGTLKPLGVNSDHPAANVNAFDEVPNSTWFTNRNHMRSLSPREIRLGPKGPIRPEVPWTIKKIKETGFVPGFQIKDKNGKRWLIKFDAPGHAQSGSGADVVSSRLIWAAGYNFSHEEAVTFRREDLKLDEDLIAGRASKPFSEQNLDTLLTLGARSSDGRYYAAASLFLEGEPLGPFSFRGFRKDDPNDWYHHRNRRELRGLFVFYSWLNNWDVKDHQSLDTFQSEKADSTSGYVLHNLLDAGASLGAAGQGAKAAYAGYELRIDFGWILKRLFTLGFIVEPWRRVNQDPGIPSVGLFEAAGFDPPRWRPFQWAAPFREMQAGDAYWGAKLVASFSDEQVAAAIDAAGYEDSRARPYLLQTLLERRDKVARYWFGKVAPLDFFTVDGSRLHFHDLARDIGLVGARSYEAEIDPGEGQPAQVMTLRETLLPLDGIHAARNPTTLRLELSVSGSSAKRVRVELTRRGGAWIVSRVRHG
jgi:hypothetical protein